MSEKKKSTKNIKDNNYLLGKSVDSKGKSVETKGKSVDSKAKKVASKGKKVDLVEKKAFSYENNFEPFEDLDYELLDKLNKGKLLKGKSYKNKSTSDGRAKTGNRADRREDSRSISKSNGTSGAGRDNKVSYTDRRSVDKGVRRVSTDSQGIDKRGADKGIRREFADSKGIDKGNRREFADNKGFNKGNEANSRTRNDSQNNYMSESKLNIIRSIKSGGCPHIREYGGCNILTHTYEEELKDKQKKVESLISKYCKVEPILGMKNPKNYRNKVHVVFDHDRKGHPISGVYEEGSHRVVPVEKCCIHNEKADAIIASIRGMLKSFKIKTFDENTGYGLFRHVLIRTGLASGEIMVVLVLSSPILPSKNNFVKALRQQHPEITTVIVNVNDKNTSMVLGDKEQVIYGKGYIEDTLCKKVFRLSPKSFYQVNPVQTELLYNKAIKWAELTGEETVIDAYCGIGTIGIIASDKAKRVIGVELNKDAVKDANINAKRNDAKNIEFFTNDAGVFMSQMAELKESADVVFMDPPRSGSTEQFMDAVVQLKPKKVVYISCSLISLERDLQYITKKGYKAVKAVPVDMFPWTDHVETVCLLYKVK